MGSEWGKSVQHQSTTPGSQFWIPSKPFFTLLWDLSRREILMTSSHAPHWFKTHKPPLLWHGNSSVYFTINWTKYISSAPSPHLLLFALSLPSPVTLDIQSYCSFPKTPQSGFIFCLKWHSADYLCPWFLLIF